MKCHAKDILWLLSAAIILGTIHYKIRGCLDGLSSQTAEKRSAH